MVLSYPVWHVMHEEEEFDENEDIVRVYIHNVDNPRWSTRDGYKGPRDSKPTFNGEGQTLGAPPRERPTVSPAPIVKPLKRSASASVPPASSSNGSLKPASQSAPKKRQKTEGTTIDLTDSP